METKTYLTAEQARAVSQKSCHVVRDAIFDSIMNQIHKQAQRGKRTYIGFYDYFVDSDPDSTYILTKLTELGYDVEVYDGTIRVTW